MERTKRGSSMTGNAKADELLENLLQATAKERTKADLKEVDNTEVVKDPNAKKIIIPVSMSKKQAASELMLQHENEEQVINVSRAFEGWNWKDVLVAVKKVSEETFGWIHGKTERTFFGTKRPQEIDVRTNMINGKEITEKCFFGKFEVAAWEEGEINVYVAQGGVAGIQTTLKKKYSEEVSTFFDDIQEHLKEKSIYRNKTVVITETKDPSGYVSVDFEIIENKGEDKIILNEKEELVIERFIIGALNERGKRCYLFTGDYGTGKTETAMRVGREGVLAQRTFFYCKQSAVFEKFLNVSKQYQPCIVFLEDVDEIGAGEERNTRMNSILNTLDGVQTKGNDITVIFTTNHQDKINPALRRPGRIDLIVNFEYPDAITKERIYMQLMEGTPGADSIDYKDVVTKTPDVQGAVIAQICKRARKLAEREKTVNTGSMIAAIASMEYQIKFMKDPVEKGSDDKELLDGLANRIANSVITHEMSVEVQDNVQAIRNATV